MVCNMHVACKQNILAYRYTLYCSKTITNTYPCTITNSYFWGILFIAIFNAWKKVCIVSYSNIITKIKTLRILDSYRLTFSPVFSYCSNFLFPINSCPPPFLILFIIFFTILFIFLLFRAKNGRTICSISQIWNRMFL